MHPSARALVAVPILLVLASCQPPQDVESEIAALKEMDRKVSEAFLNKDLDAVMAMYLHSPDLVVFPPGTLEMRGYDACRESLERFFGMDFEITGFEIKDAIYRVSGDLATSRSRVEITFQMPEAPEMTVEYRFMGAYRKQGGTWYLFLDHTSAPIPPGP